MFVGSFLLILSEFVTLLWGIQKFNFKLFTQYYSNIMTQTTIDEIIHEIIENSINFIILVSLHMFSSDIMC